MVYISHIYEEIIKFLERISPTYNIDESISFYTLVNIFQESIVSYSLCKKQIIIFLYKENEN